MIPVSDGLLRTVRGSHGVDVRARVLTEFQTGPRPEGEAIDVSAGNVQLDATADIRGTLDLTTSGVGWDPRPRKHPLQPYGNEVFVERAVIGATTEWVPLGYYRIYTVGQEETPDGKLRVTGMDRMSAVKDARLTRPAHFDKHTTVAEVFHQLVDTVLPGAVIEFDWPAETDEISRKQVIGGDGRDQTDRYGMLRDVAKSRGKVMYFDHRGVLVVKTAPDPTTPVFDVTAGDDGVIITASRSLDRRGAYNAVVSQGEGADDQDPVTAIAFDANPRSPTYWFGPFGRVPRFYFSSLLTTYSQARTAAREILARSLGLPYAVDFAAVPNPALEPYDPVRVTYGRGAEETHVLQQVTVPFREEDPFTAATREQGSITIITQDEGDIFA